MALTTLKQLDARIPKWDLDLLTARLCPFCGLANEPVLNRPDKLPVAFCGTCGCWYVATIPSLEEILKQYEGYWHVHRPSDFTSNAASQMLERARRTSKSNWQVQTLSKLLGGMVGKRILDVGCGKGGFLLSARSEGADVVGCDLAQEARQFAGNHLDIQIHQSDFISCASSLGSVDAVVMRDFIEHPVDPLSRQPPGS